MFACEIIPSYLRVALCFVVVQGSLRGMVQGVRYRVRCLGCGRGRHLRIPLPESTPGVVRK